MLYVKRPVVVEAVQYRVTNVVEVTRFLGDQLHEPGIEGLSIRTLEGTMLASPGDWIIKGVQGEFYPCKPDIFEQTYDPYETGESITEDTPQPPQANLGLATTRELLDEIRARIEVDGKLDYSTVGGVPEGQL